MKKLMAAVLAAGMGFCVFGMDIFSYVPAGGGAKNYTQTDYTITSKFGNYFRTPSEKSVHILNSSGEETLVSTYTARDVLTGKIVKNYNASGKLYEQISYDAADEVLWRTSVTFNNGVKSDVSEFGKDGSLKAKTIFTYTDGKLVDETGYDGDGALVWKIVYKYNPDGTVASQSQYSADGALDEERTYTYMDDGRIDTVSYLDGYMNSSVQEVFRYTDGKLTEITTYGSGNKISGRLLVKYDAAGNVTKLSDYSVAEKFGTTVNELVSMTDFVFEY